MNGPQAFERLLDYRFSGEHVWIAASDKEAFSGLTDYAQDALGEMVFVDLPRPGTEVQRGKTMCEVESVKAVADTVAPVSGAIVTVNESLEAHPELCNDDPYGRGWLVAIKPRDPLEFEDLYTFVDYRAEVLGEVEHVLYLDEHNRIRYFPAVRTAAGLVLTKSSELPSVFAGGLVNAESSRRLALADEFEELINDPGASEMAIQKFFEDHPEFLLGTKYERLHSQVVLQRADEGHLRPDFVLQPLAGVSHEAKIVDLKLPQQRIVKPVPNRPHLYAKITEAVAQLKTYASYFQSRDNRAFAAKALGFTSFQPKITLIVGTSVEPDIGGEVARVLADARPVEIVTYTDVLLEYRRLAQDR